ncbi:MAG: rhomboid family intramembrane serine protease [Bryobacteraceae bacterium]
MAIGTRSYARSYSMSGGIPPGVRSLLIANVAVFLVQFFGGRFLDEVFDYLKLIPAAVVKLFFIWQLGTYMFLHAGIMHILFNMLALWWFGAELERVWGTRRFLQYYFFCGIGAGICVVVGNYLFGNPAVATVGASGAIYGVLLASAILWPDREMLFYFLFPIKMKYFVMLIGAIAFLNSFNSASRVSDVAHLGGLLFGYLFLRTANPRSRGFNPLGFFRDQYRQWKLARAKKKFQVYMRKQNDHDRFVN